MYVSTINRFLYKLGYFKVLFKANLSFQIFQLTEGFGV